MHALPVFPVVHPGVEVPAAAALSPGAADPTEADEQHGHHDDHHGSQDTGHDHQILGVFLAQAAPRGLQDWGEHVH